MSHETVVYGFVEGATFRPPDYRRLQKANLIVLHNLPVDDAFPPLSRDMFSCTPLESSGTFRAQVIHFGGSMNGLNYEAVPEWIDKFEALLRQMYWFEATAHIWTDYIDGAYQYWWKASDEILKSYQTEEPKPTVEWERKRLHCDRHLDKPPTCQQ